MRIQKTDILVVIGIVLLVHHAITAKIILDPSDFVGHDWLGVILIFGGMIL